MKKTVYTNGFNLFTIENFSPGSGAKEVNGIQIHGKWDASKIRSYHANGALHRVFGIGDTKHLKAAMKRGTTIGGFEIL